MNILINYADSRYKQAQKLNTWTGKKLGHFDKIFSFGPEDVDDDFRQAHKEIFSYKRGNGLWLWKSYLLKKVIEKSEDGDYIFYIDSGALFIRDPRLLLKYIDDENPLFVTDIPLVESNFTKQECFDIMGGEEYKHTNQIQSGIIIFKVNTQTRLFFEKYFQISSTTDLLIPAGLGKTEQPQKDYGDKLVSHREDQSILSLLCKLNNIKAHRDITQRWKDELSFYSPYYMFKPVNHPQDNYPTILFLHKAPSFTIKWLLGWTWFKIRYYIIERPKLKKDWEKRLRIIEDENCSNSNML